MIRACVVISIGISFCVAQPSAGQKTAAVHYGPFFSATFEIAPGKFVNKGIAARLDSGPGGFARGRCFIVFDTDTLSCRAGWQKRGAFDWRGWAESDANKVHPAINGQLVFENPDAPGWGSADTHRFRDTRYISRGGERSGPLDRAQAQWLGVYCHGERVVWSYQVLGASVLESPSIQATDGASVFLRHFTVGPRAKAMALQVAHDASNSVEMHGHSTDGANDQVISFNAPGISAQTADRFADIPTRSDASSRDDFQGDDFSAFADDQEDEELEDETKLNFDGYTSLLVGKKEDFDLTNSAYTVVARIRTVEGGTIFAQAPADGEHAPNAKSLFVADGMLQFDIGWVGVVESNEKVDDGDWHDIAMTYVPETGDVRLYIDGQEQGKGTLRPTAAVDDDQVLRIGFTAADFPDGGPGFEGRIARVAFYQQALDSDSIRKLSARQSIDVDPIADWNRFDRDLDQFVDTTGNGHNAHLEEIEFNDPEFAGADDDEDLGDRQVLHFDGNSVRVAIGNLRGDRIRRMSYSIAARIRTKEGGPLFAVAATDGGWQPNDVCWFVRDGRLAFDMGYVGQVQGWKNVADGEWHDVAVTYDLDTGEVGFIVDGEEDQVRVADRDGNPIALRPMDVDSELKESTGWIGYASEEFPEDSPRYFSGRIARLRIYADAQSAKELDNLMRMDPGESLGVVAAWVPAFAVDGVVEDLSDNGFGGKVLGTSTLENTFKPTFYRTSCGVVDAPADSQWLVTNDGQVRLSIPAGDEPVQFTIVYIPLAQGRSADTVRTTLLPGLGPSPDLTELCHGGERNWNLDTLSTPVVVGSHDSTFVVDDFGVPVENPYGCPMRLTGLDFFGDGRSAAVCTLAGDVWLVEGLGVREPSELRWRRVAAGLHTPMGLKIVRDRVYVTCRDQITGLRDLNGDGEVDYYECLNGNAQITSRHGELAVDLQIDADGNYYYLRTAPTDADAVVAQHGTLLQVSPDGSATKLVAKGFGAPGGVCVNPDGTYFVTDQAGSWSPKNRINLVRAGRFYGNRDGFFEGSPDKDEPPIVWIHDEFDQAPAGLLYVDGDRWGPLEGQLLCLSNSSGGINVVLRQDTGGVLQAGLYRLPIARLPIAVGRGRFNARDGQLYVCGYIDSLTGRVTDVGGLYRIRFNHRSLTLPVGLAAREDGISVSFSGPLDLESSTDWRNFSTSRWGYRRSTQAGSDDYRISDSRKRGRDRHLVRSVEVTDDKKTLKIALSDMQPAAQMELKFDIRSAAGERLEYNIHQTIHRLDDADRSSMNQ